MSRLLLIRVTGNCIMEMRFSSGSVSRFCLWSTETLLHALHGNQPLVCLVCCNQRRDALEDETPLKLAVSSFWIIQKRGIHIVLSGRRIFRIWIRLSILFALLSMRWMLLRRDSLTLLWSLETRRITCVLMLADLDHRRVSFEHLHK